jgi:hypothetical protein
MSKSEALAARALGGGVCAALGVAADVKYFQVLSLSGGVVDRGGL